MILAVTQRNLCLYKTGGAWCPLKLNRRVRRAANPCKTLVVFLHLRVCPQPRLYLAEDSCSVFIGRGHNLVMHPFTVTPGINNTRTPEIRKVPRDLWLIRLYDLDKEADADFTLAHEIY